MHGGDIYRNQVKYDFSVNVNPLGMPPAVSRALRKSLSLANRYPDPQCQELRNALSEKHGVPQDRIICGNGASELIASAVRACSVHRALLTAPSFTGYREALSAIGADIRAVPAKDLAEQVAVFQPDLCIAANPNNPDGSSMGRYQVETLARICRENGTVLLLDECFIELSDRGNDSSFIPLLDEYDNVLILRAFTKSHALAGVRIGYTLAAPTLAERIQKQLPEWNVSVPAQMAGVAACHETGWIQKTMKLVIAERDYLTRELSALGCTVYPSHANFLLFQLKDYPDLQNRLLQKGILIRDCSDYDGLTAGHYRIAVKTHRENRKLIQVLQEVTDDRH